MLIAFLLAVATPNCTYDRAAMMTLPQQAFDQSATGGWRELSMRGCEAEAADLIRDWRETNKSERNASILYWHEGQLRADLEAVMDLEDRVFHPILDECLPQAVFV
jgi:hypothetical protein